MKSTYNNPKITEYQKDLRYVTSLLDSESQDRKDFVKAFKALLFWVVLMISIWFGLIAII